MRVDVYTWQDAYVATIGPRQLLAFTHTDELNGEDSVAITTTFPLKQGYRLVWADRSGTAHEHVCQDPKGLRSGGETLYTDTALNSICELYGDYVEDKRPHSYSYLKALQDALGPTRWAAGTVDQPGTVSSGLTFYHTSAREALQSILGCGGELETTIAVGSSGVTSRKVGIRQHRGSSSGHRRFTYTKDLVSVSRTEHFGAITACYGYGKGVETDSGGYGRKLTFGSINGGKDYVEDAGALKAYGRPDGSGGWAHVFGTFEDSGCEDAKTLLSETRAYLDEHSEPGMTYECDVVDLVQFGRDWEGVAVGDDVQVVDREFEPELRLSGRVSKLVTDELGGAQTVTLGNVTETMADLLAAQQQAVSSLSRRSSSWDVAANTPAAYLQQVIDGLNEQFNTQGMSYCFTSFEKGTIWSSVPLDEDGNPTKAGGSAIQICSQGFRIASGTKADGSYDWRTFGTGEGFTADEITSGSINADLITSGTYTIKDSDGNAVVRMGSEVTGGMQVYDPYSQSMASLNWTAFRPYTWIDYKDKSGYSFSKTVSLPASDSSIWWGDKVSQDYDSEASAPHVWAGPTGRVLVKVFGSASSTVNLDATNSGSADYSRWFTYSGYVQATMAVQPVRDLQYGSASTSCDVSYLGGGDQLALAPGESRTLRRRGRADGVVCEYTFGWEDMVTTGKTYEPGEQLWVYAMSLYVNATATLANGGEGLSGKVTLSGSAAIRGVLCIPI